MMTIREVSHLAYDMNRILVGMDGMGDEIEVVLPAWEETSEKYRDISILCTRAVLLHPAGIPPQIWFEDFKRLMIESGWTYGLQRDEDAMTHPYLTDFRNLTDAQKQRLFLYAIVVDKYRRELGEE